MNGSYREMQQRTLEIRRIDEELELSLVIFFDTIRETEDEQYFHPHAFDAATAQRVARYSGLDLYFAILEGDRMIGYGMLRGWDEGYEVPSLGIIIHPAERGHKLGDLFMQFLHAVARRRGAKQIRLTVCPANEVALRMYTALGYVFSGEEARQMVGVITL